MASSADMTTARNLGYEACVCGWVAEGSVMAPKPSGSCKESGGENTMSCNGRQTWDVYCLNKF